MKARTGPTTRRHNVGTCPACRECLWCEVDVMVYLSEPTVTREGKAVVSVNPEIVAMRLEHECARPDDEADA